MHAIKRSIQLTTEPLLHLIETGSSIDFRLDEPAWQDIEVGDYLEFWQDFSGFDKAPSPKSIRATVQVAEIFRASSFAQLIDQIPPSFTRNEPREDILMGLREWWTEEKEREVGVLGWRVDLV